MSGPMNFLYVAFMLAMLVLASVQVWWFWQNRETERQRIARETREAERQIDAIGRQAQEMILQEALKRAQMKPKATRLGTEGMSNTDGRLGPWND